MSDCSKHRKDVFGETDMEKLATEICDLHYESLAQLFFYMTKKLETDSDNDRAGSRTKLAGWLNLAARSLRIVTNNIYMAWRLSKPHMEKKG